MRRFSFSRLKCRWAGLALALLPFAFNAPAVAQSDTDAFYIYQNDGHFDGFFYDQVQKISYSRVDTAGVEWDEYVSQEIVTEDSTYRIMLTAIDSVSFVQPEIRFNPQVRMMDKDGSAQYIISGGSMMLVMRSDVPATLMPKPGEVLACVSLPGSGDPFVGRVVTTYEFDGKLHVACEKVTQLKDIFEQFVTVEEVVSNDEGQHVRRRIAGMGPRRAEGNWNGDLFQMNVDVEDSYSLSDSWSVILGLHCGFAMRAQVVYNITWSKFFLKMLLEERVELGGKISIDGTIGERDNVLEKGAFARTLVNMSRLHFPANFPLLYLDIAPKPFLRGDAHFNVGVSAGVTSRFFQQWFLISSENPYFDFDLVSRNLGDLAQPSFSVTAELNGMVQAGVKFPLRIGTEDYMEKIVNLNVGNTLYTGPKLTGALSLDIIKAVTGSGVYESFKNTKLNGYLYSFDNELSMNMRGLWGKPMTRSFKRSLPMGAIELGLFPQFENVHYEFTDDRGRNIRATMDVNGEVFCPQTIGFAIYDRKGNRLHWKTRSETYLINTFNKVDVEFTDLEPGSYIIRPITRIFGMEVPIYSEEEKFNVETPQLKLVPSVLKFDEEGGTEAVTAEGGLGGELTYYCEQDWIHPRMYSRETVVQVVVDPNETMRYREGKVIVSERISDVEELTDTLIVKQYGGITVSQDHLEFSEEGGVEVIEVKTNLTSVRCNITEDTDSRADWLHAVLSGEALTVLANANSSCDRSATISITAPNKIGNGIVTTNVTVTQKSLMNIPCDTIHIDSGGGENTIDITTALPQITVEEDADWLSASYYANKIYVNARENNGDARETEIVVTATDGVKMASKTLIVAQKGNENPIWPSIRTYSNSVTIPGRGGDIPITVYTNMPGIEFQTEYSGDDNGWLSARYEVDKDQCYFKASANRTKKTRKATVKMVVSNRFGEDYEEVTVTQPPYEEVITYDGVAVTFRFGGDITAELMSDSLVYSVTRPTSRGVYASCSANDEGATVTSSGSDGSLGNWNAHFTINKGVMYGSFTWTDWSGKYGYRFNISGAPAGTGGPLNHAGAFRGDTYWQGAASFCYPPVDVWGRAIVDPSETGYISGYDAWEPTSNGDIRHISYYEKPVEINVFLRRSDAGGDLPWGYPTTP